MLIYKKILLENNNGRGAGGAERLEQREERKDYKEKIKDLKKEISDLSDRKHDNDEIKSDVFENENNTLTAGFSEALKNADRGTINDLVKKLEEAVRKINLDGEVEDEIKKSASNLCDQLKSIQVNRIFDDFKKMIESGDLKDLNSFKDDEITILRNGIEGNSIPEKAVLELYNAMNTGGARHFRHTDKRYYTDIKSTIERHYFGGSANTEDNKNGIQGRIDEIGKQELNELFPSDIDAKGLNKLAKDYAGATDWTGADLEDMSSFKDNGKSFTADNFKDKFNPVNQERIGGVKDAGNYLISIMDLNNLTAEENDGTITFKRDGNEVNLIGLLGITKDDMKDLDILNVEELDAEHFKNVVNEWKNTLKARIENDNSVRDNADNQEVSEATEGTIIENCKLTSADFQKIKDSLRNDCFIEEKDNGYTYNMAKLTGFLRGISSDNRREYRNLSRGQGRTVGSGKWKALHCAVQILLNKQDQNPKLDVNGKWIHSRRNRTRNAYYKAVYDFQGKYGLNQDGIPGPNTIKKLLDNEQKTESGSGSASGDNSGNDNEGGNNNAPTVVEIANPGDLGLSEKTDLLNKESLGIPKGKVYTKTDNSNDNGLYYQENNQLVRISTDDPWIKRTATMPSNGNNLPEVSSMAQTLNVCAKGAEKLNDIIKDHFQGYEFSVNADKYEFKHDGNVVDLGNDFFENNLGESEITNKLQEKLNESQNSPS